MRIVTLALLVGMSLVAACAPIPIGASGAGGLPPKLPAGAHVPLWDHYCANPNGKLAEVLTAASAEGWELVGVSMTGSVELACFKRPRVEAGTPALAPTE